MVKDKRAMVQMNDFTNRKFEKLNTIQQIVSEYLMDACQKINLLITAQGIDVSLYVQDEMDRQHTVLYGLNEDAGKVDPIEKKSTISVNKHCMSCSGNSSYIKKAFKIACL